MNDLWPIAANPLARAFSDAKREVMAAKNGKPGIPAPGHWEDWLRGLFPQHCTAPFARRHGEFWETVYTIEPDSSPDPFVSPWPRGGAKSTSAELGAVNVGVREKRKYVWYVSETQDQADKHVENMAALLESESIERHYPRHSEKLLGKHGNSRGWRRNRLRTEGGFTVDALGLDTAARGLKVEEQRPDLIILDDIDNKHDTPATTAKKVATITTSILPAGASNVAVWVIQNLIIPDGFVSRIVDGRADYLTQRVVSGPHPAIEGFEWEWVPDHETGTREAKITAGVATWAGQSLAVCQHLINTIGISAFQKECQHQVSDRSEGIALRYDEARHLEDLSDEEAKHLVTLGQSFAGIDFGAWRFAFVLRAADEGGRAHQIAEYFSQRDEMEHRARVITGICTHYRAPHSLRVWGDSANPTDIMELNAALKRIKSPYRVMGVAAQHKIRLTGVERMNDLLTREALLYRRGVMNYVQDAVIEQWELLKYAGAVPELRTWLLGYNASSQGVEMEGSRLQWEARHWAYPTPKEGLAQLQDPDDHTADGADALSSDRYALMSWWKQGKAEPVDDRPSAEHYDRKGDELMKEMSKRYGPKTTKRWRKA